MNWFESTCTVAQGAVETAVKKDITFQVYIYSI